MSASQFPSTGRASQPSRSSSEFPESSALARGFKKVFISSSPSLAPPRVGAQPDKPPRIVAGAARSRAAPASAEFDVGLVRASDVAFPSRNDHPDRFPSIPFVLDKKELAKASLPSKSIIAPGVSDAEADSFLERSHMETRDQREPGDDTISATCMLTFGHGHSSHAVVVCGPATRQYLRAHPLFEKTLFVEPLASTMPFYVADVPGRGKGLFAARRLAKGECLLREPPMLVFPQAMGDAFLMQFDDLINQYMPERVKAALDALYCCWPSADFSRRIGVIRTNAVGINLPSTSAASGAVFQLVSRLNHSCVQNTAFEWDHKTFQGSLYADREIAGGEELTICYVDPRASKAVRRAQLQKKYKFACTCSRCGPD